MSFSLFFLGITTNAQAPTYYKDVEPIISAKCISCHKPGESAPFPLLTFADVAKRATFIKQVIRSGFMPPWKADNHYALYSNDRTLSEKEKKTIIDWVDAKTPKGKPGIAKANKIIAKPVASSNLRKPDLSLRVSETITIAGDNKERFVVYKIPFDLKDSENVEGVEFYSTNKKAIHHANYSIHPVDDPAIDLYSTASSINLTDDDRSKYSQYMPYKRKQTYYAGWIPGTSRETYPSGFGWVMPKRGVILLTVHYAPLAKDDITSLGVNLFFTQKKIERNVRVIGFGSGGIGEESITPEFYIEKNNTKKFTLKLTNPSEDMSLLYAWPHMHYIGKIFKAYAVTPAKDTINLVHIPRWDFRWQEMYKFKHLVRIPKGSLLVIEGTYDNTAENPFNPNIPPQDIYSSGDMKSTDEMLTLLLVFLSYKEGDENINLE